MSKLQRPTNTPKRRVVTLAAVSALAIGGLAAVALPAQAIGTSKFEITDGNTIVNTAGNLDWNNVSESRKDDLPTGSGDNSFGNGTKEDTPVPSVIDGSIPNNKSDLKTFGTYLETTASGARYLNMYWTRVQEPTGTTNMDFEFNQSSTISSNGVTPVRTAGDALIQYDLAQGGTHPQLFVSRWVATGPGSQCQANNATPCWGTRVDLSAAGSADGSINTAPIAQADSGGLGALGARTFGEAQVDFNALSDPNNPCFTFGSAYLKSRSSDSFTAAVKDFIAPAPTNINNCATVIIRKQTDPASTTPLFGFTKSFATSPSSSNTFSLADDGVKTFTGVVQGSGFTVNETSQEPGWDFNNVNCSASTGVTPVINGSLVTFAIDAASDVLDCTYNNRARGTLIVEKITDDGNGAFDYTSSTLDPAAFTLTTTAAGAAGKDSRTFSNLLPGTYDVAETVPANWNLVGTPSCTDSSPVSAISISGGETVTCTFHNARERGAIDITKTYKHAASGSGDHPQSGVTFTVSGNGITPVAVVTDALGQACVDGLLDGDYTVTETVPSGYHSDDAVKEATVTDEATCTAGTAASVSFHNTPLTDITVSVDSQVDGGTASVIDCGGTNTGSTGADGDGSVSVNDLEPTAPGVTLTCTITVDP